jgi:DNA repair exonuclease SbcCD ATPase subunit
MEQKKVEGRCIEFGCENPDVCLHGNGERENCPSYIPPTKKLEPEKTDVPKCDRANECLHKPPSECQCLQSAPEWSRDQMTYHILCLEKELADLRAWKVSEIKLWGPVIEFMQKHPDLQVGDSISEHVLKFLKEHLDLRAELETLNRRMKEDAETLAGKFGDLLAERDRWVKYCDVHIEEENKLKAELDKLKEDLREHGTTRNRLLSANSDIQRLKADNERLKEQIQTWHDNYDKHVEQFNDGFTSELQRRWPSEELMEAHKYGPAQHFIEWLKSYLENK